MLQERTQPQHLTAEADSTDDRTDDRTVPCQKTSEHMGLPNTVWTSTPQMLPMDKMPGAVPVHEIPFGMESEISAICPPSDACDDIPAGLGSATPGPVLSGLLSSIDITRISASAKVVVLQARQRMASHYQAGVLRSMSDMTDSMTNVEEHGNYDAEEGASAEACVALHLSRRAASRQVAFALTATKRLPRLGDMLANGDIDMPRAMAIDRFTLHLTDIEAQAVLDKIADMAPGMTTSQLKARIGKLTMAIDPDEAKKRYEKASNERMIFANLNPSGTADLIGLDLPPEKVATITDRIEAIARAMRVDGETRSINQLRADIYIDLLTGNDLDATRRGIVDIQVDLTTLIGLDEHPGELAGFGPVIADVARRIVCGADDAQWRVTITDPETGKPTHAGTTSRRPTASQRRRVEIRDPNCVFPGCRMPSTRSDIDHMQAVADGGKTTDENLAPLCRYHHRIKHQHGWSYQRTTDQNYEWTTRFGQVSTTLSGDPP